MSSTKAVIFGLSLENETLALQPPPPPGRTQESCSPKAVVSGLRLEEGALAPCLPSCSFSGENPEEAVFGLLVACGTASTILLVCC